MANAAVAFANLADAASISASDYVLLAPPTRLLDPQVGVKWRDNTTTTYILADLGSLQSLDTVMLAGVNGLVPTFQVRLSSVDNTGAAGDVYDSGVVTGLPYFDPDYGLFVFLKSTPASAVPKARNRTPIGLRRLPDWRMRRRRWPFIRIPRILWTSTRRHR